MNTLKDILLDTTNEILTSLVKLLGVKSSSPRKADLIDVIHNSLLGGELNAIWSSLSQLEQRAVAEACYAFDLRFDEKRFLAKYENLPPFYKMPKGSRNFSGSRDLKFATRLNLLLFEKKHDRVRRIPNDLAERLKEFVPAPVEFSVSTLEEPSPEEGLYVRQTEFEALSEVKALLRLAEQGDFRISEKTAMPSAEGCRNIIQCLSGGDFYPPEIAYVENKQNYDQEIGPIKPVGWSRLIKNGKYIAKVGSKSKLTPIGIKALSKPSHKVIEHLWNKWLSNSTFDEFNRISEIKGQNVKGHMTAKPPRREAITDALLACPANKWISLENFSRYMQADDFEFDVSNNHWKLYLCDKQYGSFGYEGYGEWNIVQFRYILALLFEYAATLGLIDIAYVHPKMALDDFSGQWGADDLEWLSRYDGLRAFRITNLGAFCLGMTDEFVPTKSRSSLKLEVLSNLSIRIISGSPQPAEMFLLETWAESVAENTWCLEPKRAREAIERGQSISDFVEFLSQCDDQALPGTVKRFLKNCDSDGKALQSLGEAQVFRCRDADTASVICAQRELKHRCFMIDDSQLVVPSVHLEKFRKVVKTLGLGIV